MIATTCLLLLATASVITGQSVPQFESSSSLDVGINERPQQGDLVIATRARGLGGEIVMYGIDLPSNAQGVFEINPLTGQLTVGPSGPDRLVIVDNTPITITADVFAYYNSSGSAEQNRAYVVVNVEVLDINDAPDFGSTTVDISTSASSAVGSVIRRVSAVDHDLGVNGVFTYTLQQVLPAGQPTFTINQFTGDLILSQSLNLQTTYQLRITATDFGVPALSSSVTATVRVAPVPPTFQQPVYTAQVLEFNSQTPMTLVTTTATDSAPITPGTVIVYDIGTVVPMTTDITFSVGRFSGVVTVRGNVDRETHSRYLVQVLAYESGHEVELGAGMTNVVVTINDVNEPPEFLSSHYSIEITEGAGVGDTLFSGLRAVDNDEGTNSDLTYTITTVTGFQTLDGIRIGLTASAFFLINPQTAVITVNTNLEREAVVDGYHYYELTVTVADSGSPSLSDTASITVTVRDINDNPPEFAEAFLNYEIPENSPTASPVGEFTVSDRDQGTSAEMNFRLEGNMAERFTVRIVSVTYSTTVESQPPVITRAQIVTTESLDREDVSSYQFILTASDRSLAPLSASIAVSIDVAEVNDNAPMFTRSNFSFTIAEDTTSFFISQFTVTDADIGSNGQVGFSLSTEAIGLFSLTILDPFRAELSVSHSLDRDTTDSYNFRIFATDRGSPTLMGEADITIIVTDVNDNPPIFSSSLYQATVVENIAPGLFLTTVSATDADINENGEVFYMVPDSTLVAVNESSGEVTLASSPDYEMGATVSVQILAIDRGEPAMTGSTMLLITVSDVNDNAPIFQADRLNVSVLEGLPVGSQFAQIVATDADSGEFGRITFSIVLDDEVGLFQIDSSSGYLTVHRILDREGDDVASYTIAVQASDNGNPPLNSQVFVDIQVGDANDHTPFFINLPYITTVDEGSNESVGVFVYTVSAQDDDIGINAQIAYSLAGTFVEFFSIHPSTGVISVSDNGVDFEALGGNPIVILTVIATDLGEPPRISSTTINITVIDGNDNAPEFVGTPYISSIPESNSTTQELVVTVMATDRDRGAAGMIRFELVGGDSDFFEIDGGTGQVFLPAGVYFDREANVVPHNENGDAVYRFGVAARDMGSPVQVSFTTVSLLVTDINDNSPMFPTDTIRETISESLPVGATVLTLAATDQDFGSNARINYSIVSEQTSAGTITQDFTFSVSSDTGVLSLARTLDRETTSEVTLVVAATDQGAGNNQDRVTVYFNVSDANDNRPVFTIPEGGYKGSVPEDALVGTVVTTVMATDLDQGLHQSITYRVLSNTTSSSVPFQIPNPSSGVITVSGALDREMTSEYQLLVIASDSASNPGNIQQTFATVLVAVTDVNDNAPQFGVMSYQGSVRENAPAGTTVQLTPMLTASDLDTTPFFFSLQGNGAEFLVINQTSGVIVTSAPLDYEQQQLYPDLTLRVSDGLFTSTAPLRVAIMDENDNSPVFSTDSVSVSFPEDTTIGTEVLVAMATDIDVGVSGVVTYSLDSDESDQFFAINPTSGVVTLVRALDFETEQMHSFTVIATDSGTNPLNGTLDVTILVEDLNDHPPMITDFPMSPSVSEGTPVGTSVGVVTAQDGDLGADSGSLVYAIVSSDGGSFVINETTGLITVSGELDRETQDQYDLLVRVMDTTAFPLSDQVTVRVTIDDANDNAPTFPPGDLVLNIVENTLPPAFVGSPIVASDADLGDNSRLLFSIESQFPEPHFSINELSGQLSVAGSLDRESIESYSLNITARDQGNPPLEAYRTVEVVILDENDNSPIFFNQSFTLEVREGFYEQPQILLVAEASDIDEQGDNSRVTYSIVSVLANGQLLEPENGSFVIDPNFGEVSVQGEVDREMFSSYSVQLQATDNSPSPRMTQALLTVTVLDVNDNPPEFDPSTNTLLIVPEGTASGSIITVLRATDPDEGTNAVIQFQNAGTNPEANLFSIQQDGSVLISGTLDFESLQSSNIPLLVAAINTQADVFLSAVIELTIVVRDINDNNPMFSPGFSRFYSISEGLSVGSFVLAVPTTDADSGENAEVSLSIVNSEVPFRIDDSSNLLVDRPLDRETTPQYSVLIEAVDRGLPMPLSSQVSITISILDENDNLPQFVDASPEFTIREDLTPGRTFGIIDTTDRDQQKVAFYYVLGGFSPIGIDSRSGGLFLRTNIDYDAGQQVFSVVVAAVSTESNPGSSCNVLTCSTATVTVNVEDWNDNAPVLREFDFGVNQSSPVNTMIGQVMATDVDTGEFGRVNYEFGGPQPLFSIGANDGVIRLSEIFNASADSKYNEVQINAYDNPSIRQPTSSFTTPSVSRIYFVEERELVIMVLTNSRLSDIQQSLNNTISVLANTGEPLGVYIFEIEEYTTTLDLSTPSPNAPQRRQIIEVPKVNITMFGVNHTARGVLLSDDFLSLLSSLVESTVSQFATIESISAHPVPLPANPGIPMETILLILYIVVGTLGGLIIIIVVAVCIACCCLALTSRRKSYMPGTGEHRSKSERTKKNTFPLRTDPYGKWAENVDLEGGEIQYRERSVDVPLTNRESEEFRDSVLYSSKEYQMGHFVETSDNKEEVDVEIKPVDTQSLSQQSAGGSTFDRNIDKKPLLPKDSQPWDDDTLEASGPKLELTADDDEEETGSEEYTEDDDDEQGEESVEEGSEEGEEEYEDEDEEEGSEEEGSEEGEEEDDEEEYEDDEDPNFPEDKDWSDDEFPMF